MSQAPDTAVILAGSPATFHGLTLGPYPKFLLSLANRPLVHYQAQILAEAGVKRLILCVAAEMAARVTAPLQGLHGDLTCLVRETVHGTGAP